MRIQALGGALLLSWAAATLAQETTAEAPKPTFTFAMHGFVSGSVYAQDASLGPSEGQQSLYVNSQPPRQPVRDRMIFGGDVRQSRFNFSVAGPQLPAFGEAIPRAVLEIDFFGGYGSGNYGDISLVPRLRRTWAELDWGGGNRIYFGQDNDLIFTIAPVSLAHIAFPYSYGAGNIGWRRPGFWGTLTAGDKKSTNLEFAWEVGRSQWADAASNIGNSVVGTSVIPTGGSIQNAAAGGDAYGFSTGEASGLPAVEARLMLANGANWSLFTTGHWNRVDRSGVGAGPYTTPGGISSDLDVLAVNAGGKFKAGPLQLAATGFVGKNLAPLVGSFLQFQANNVGDIHDKGGWVQAGLNLTQALSVWGFIGAELPNETEAIAAHFGKLRNVTSVGMIQYRDSVKVAGLASDYAIAFEWVHMDTRLRAYESTTITAAEAAELSGDVGGNQWMLTGNYFF